VRNRNLLVFVLLLLAGCGPDRSRPPAAPLGPEHYVIAPEDRPEPGAYLRYAPPAVGQAGGLDIAITHLTPADGGPAVALVGVVHVADKPYFDTLQQELDGYDIVLYEGVKPEQLSNVDWQRSFTEGGGEAANLQRDLAGWFGFAYQLEAIDYGRKNFVHADMSMEAFLAAGGGDMIPGAGKKASARAADDAPAPAGADEEATTTAGEVGAVGTPIQSTWKAVKAFGDAALGAPGPLRSMARKMFAETMGTTDIGAALAMRPGFSELILEKRNQVVLERLAEVVGDAKGPIAIFYGAAHMDDLEAQLTSKFGYSRSSARWLRAWAIRPPLR